MKKILLWMLSLSLFFVLYPQNKTFAFDTSVPYSTYTLGPNNQTILTQTAYQPAGFFPLQKALKTPTDMGLFNDHLYLLNSGDKEVWIYHLDFTYIKTLFLDFLVTPTGIDVDAQFIYIADKGAKAVFRVTHDGVLDRTFLTPTEPIFGLNNPFIPTKVEVGPRGVIYVVGEGATSGIMQFSNQGEFLGYFGTNRTANAWLDVISDFLGVQYALNIPTSATNLKMDNEGSLFTISPTDAKPLKRFNIASVDTLNVSFVSRNLTSLAISSLGHIITLSTDGVLTEYDPFGRLIFTFGGLDPNNNRIQGLLVLPVDIEVSEQQTLYVLDQGLNAIQMYMPTSFTQTIHEGLVSFNDGIFDIALWQNVLSFNEMFALANQAIGQASFRTQDYETALHYFELAQYKDGYSDTFWQIRYAFLQQSLGTVFLVLILFFVGLKLGGVAHKRYHIYQPFITLKTQLLSVKLLRELSIIFDVIKHPLNTFYDIKFRQKSSYKAAFVLFFIALGMTIISTIGPSFLFRDVSIVNFSLTQHLLIYIGVSALLIFSNYLIATINDGEGYFKHIFIGFAYSLAPFIFMTIPLVILSYGLTLFESFIYQFLWTLTYGLTAFYALLMIKEMHGYNIRALIKNLILTVLTTLLLILILFIAYLLLNQVYDYLMSIIREVLSRV